MYIYLLFKRDEKYFLCCQINSLIILNTPRTHNLKQTDTVITIARCALQETQIFLNNTMGFSQYDLFHEKSRH